MDIILKPQEESTNAQFIAPLVATANFMSTFSDEATSLALATLSKVRSERVPLGADYLQVREYKNITYWIIDDGNVITALMPEDY